MKLEQFVPKNIQEVKAYVPGKTIAEVVEAYKPERISKLASNENRLGCSTFVDEAVQKALKNIQDYPDPVARSLKKAVSEFYKVAEQRIMFGAGSESLLSGLFRSFCAGNENIVTADATFVGAFIQAKIRNVAIKHVPLVEGYRFDVKGIAEAIDESTKMVYIANPNNPTGTYINTDEFEWLMQQIPENVLVVMDEAYYEYTHEIEDYPDVLKYDHDNVIVLRTFSKGYGLAGLRIGYAIAHPDLITYMMKTRMTFEPDAVAQAAALAALKDQEFLDRSRKMVQEGKSDLAGFLEKHGVTYAPSAANFIMIDLEDAERAATITQQCLEQGVIVRHITGFGLPTCIRVTIGTLEEMNHFKESFTSAFL